MFLENNPYQDIRGFNYWPSYAMVLDDVMDRFCPETVERELEGARRLGANCVRVWVSNVSWQRDADRFLKDFAALLRIADGKGISVMPALFNRWVDTDYPVGVTDLTTVLCPLSGANRDYLRSFVGAFRDDPRILMWDICNEPFFYFPLKLGEDALREMKRAEISYWLECIEAIRELKPVRPLTIGFAGAADRELLPLYRALDVISFHPYSSYWDDGFAKFTDEFIALANECGKPLLCSETCQGSLDDGTRAEIIQRTLDPLTERKIGWIAWHLCEGKIVTGNRERTDGNGRPGERGYMPFLAADGSIRPHHEIVLKYTGGAGN